MAAVALGSLAASADPRVVVSVETFDSSLSPYGEWVVTSDVGRVWRPSPRIVGDDFVPYTSGGHWVLTDDGWVFESEYAWGWAPFHYGRWYLSSGYGWVWAPDTTWGPAWVEWRHGGGYSGWAPLPPSRLVRYSTPWFFVETRYVGEAGVRRYVLPGARVHEAMAVTARLPPSPAAVGRTSWNMGPPVADVERHAGHAISRAERQLPPSPAAAPRPPAPPMMAAPPARGNDRPPAPPAAVREPSPERREPPRQMQRAPAMREEQPRGQPQPPHPAMPEARPQRREAPAQLQQQPQLAPPQPGAAPQQTPTKRRVEPARPGKGPRSH